jgi:hypothetical protein
MMITHGRLMKLIDLSNDQLKLMMGELSAQEIRTLRNFINYLTSTISIEALSELSTAELPVQGEAVAIADSITLRMLKTWCHTNRFRIEIDLGGVATAGTFGNMRRLWDADLLTMFPALNTRRESDTPTLKPSVNELVEAMKSFTNAVEKLAFSMPAPNDYTPKFIQLVVQAQSVIASHQSAKEQL